MSRFSQKISKVGINPCVVPPKDVLKALFTKAQKNKGPIPVRGRLNGALYTQTLVKYQGKWRLYINTPMLKASGLQTGDIAHVEIAYDARDRSVPMHARLLRALQRNKRAKGAFAMLTPHRQREINRYMRSLKSPEALERSVEHVMALLTGKKPKGLHALLRVK
jgi:hypothetical protein